MSSPIIPASIGPNHRNSETSQGEQEEQFQFSCRRQEREELWGSQLSFHNYQGNTYPSNHNNTPYWNTAQSQQSQTAAAAEQGGGVDSFGGGEDWSQFVEDDFDDESSSTASLNLQTTAATAPSRIPRCPFGGGEGSSKPVSRTTSAEYSVSSNNQNSSNNNNSNNNAYNNVVIELPPTLHPAVSEGMRRISSCYYSIQSTSSNNSGGGNSTANGFNSNTTANGSLVDILAFLDCQSSGGGGFDDGNNSLGSMSASRRRAASHSSLNSLYSSTDLSNQQQQQQQQHVNDGFVEDLLYHDILMNVFSYLDVDSLASFSETALRPNFEVFYYLQLQLQRALLVSRITHHNTTNDEQVPCNDKMDNSEEEEEEHDAGLCPITGTARLTRLAQTEYKAAEQIVQGYLDSNTSLRQMPLSHSLEYIRQLLMRQRILLLNHINSTTSNATSTSSSSDNPLSQKTPDTSFFSGAALLIALIGAASFMNSDAMTSMNVDSFMPPAAELPNMLFRVGFVGSLMSAVRSFATNNKNGTTSGRNDNNGTPNESETNDDGNNNDHDRNSNGRLGTGGSDMKQRAVLMKQQAEQFANNMMRAFVVLLDDNHGEMVPHIDNGTSSPGQQQKKNTSMTAGVRSMMMRMIRAALTYGGHPDQFLFLDNNSNAHGYPTPQQRRQRANLVSPNPYDHLPSTKLATAVIHEEHEDDENDDANESSRKKQTQPQEPTEAMTSSKNEEGDIQRNSANPASEACHEEFESSREGQEGETRKKSPSGCVGAYRRAISQVNQRLIELVKEERLRKYKNLDDDEQRRLGTTLLDSCATDEGLENVKNIVYNGIDVEDFYFASDGTETSPLHAAAFHGASSVLEFLCKGLEDENVSGDKKSIRRRQQHQQGNNNDGGLCQVNLKDPNGWTALHFAAGTNSTSCIQILAKHGADLTIEAANGYTPLQWAIRLQNTEAADELRELLAQYDHRRKKSKALDLSSLLFDNRGH